MAAAQGAWEAQGAPTSIDAFSSRVHGGGRKSKVRPPMHLCNPCTQLAAAHESQPGTSLPYRPVARHVRERCYIDRASAPLAGRSPTECMRPVRTLGSKKAPWIKRLSVPSGDPQADRRACPRAGTRQPNPRVTCAWTDPKLAGRQRLSGLGLASDVTRRQSRTAAAAWDHRGWLSHPIGLAERRWEEDRCGAG